MQDNNNTTTTTDLSIQTAKHEHHHPHQHQHHHQLQHQPTQPLPISLPQTISISLPQPMPISLPQQPQQKQEQPLNEEAHETTQMSVKIEKPPDTDCLDMGGPGKLKKPKKRKKPTDGSKPKNKMITGYIIYASEIRKEIIKKYPEKDFGDISKIVGTEWKSLSQETKVAFEKRAQEQNNMTKMMNEKAEAALELMKLADAAVPRDLEHQNSQPPQAVQQEHNQLATSASPTAPQGSYIYPPPEQQQFHPSQQQVALLIQQQQQQQQQHHIQQQQQPLPLSPNNSCDVPFQGPQLNPPSCQSIDPNNNNTCRTPTPNQETSFAQQFQQQHPPLSITPNYPFSAQSTPPVQSYFYNYSQAPNIYPQTFMNQSTPLIMRPGSASSTSLNSNDANIQQHQQQPMHIIQQQQQQQFLQQQQQPNMVQYCNGSCCFVNGRSPYPMATTPNVMSSPYYHTPPMPYQQQPPQPPTTPIIATTPVQQSRKNNIIYRKPAIVHRKAIDTGTQTDPISWVEKPEESKKILKHSKEFIEHFNRKIINNSNVNTSGSDNSDSVELDVSAEHH